MMATSIINNQAEAIYYTQLASDVTLQMINTVKNYFPKEIISRIESGTNQRLKVRQYISKAILVEICKRKNIDPAELRQIYYAKNGKMRFQDDKYYVSMSYSQNMVACYLGTQKKGLDIEVMDEAVDIKKRNLLAQLTHEKINSTLKFYRLWTTIESLVKYHDNSDMYQILREKEWRKTPVSISKHTINKIIFSVASENFEKLKIIKL